MNPKEFAISIINKHFCHSSFEDAKSHSLITLNFIQQESNCMLLNYFNSVKKEIEEMKELDLIKK